MVESCWNDRKCSKCRALAHYRTDMYLKRMPAPGLEYLCKICLETSEVPPKTALIVTNCAEPGCPLMAHGRLEALSSLPEQGEIPEILTNRSIGPLDRTVEQLDRT
jgi:hypothetical protein